MAGVAAGDGDAGALGAAAAGGADGSGGKLLPPAREQARGDLVEARRSRLRGDRLLDRAPIPDADRRGVGIVVLTFGGLATGRGPQQPPGRVHQRGVDLNRGGGLAALVPFHLDLLEEIDAGAQQRRHAQRATHAIGAE